MVVMSSFLSSVWQSNPLASSVEFWESKVPVDFGVTNCWIAWFAIFFVVCVLLLANKRAIRVFEGLSRNLLLISLPIWLLGVAVYIIGFYNAGLNGFAVIPRAVISSFKMFMVANELARVDKALQTDALYMSVFTLLHFTAAFITFLFIFKMIGYKMRSSVNMIKHRLFYSKCKVVHLFWGVNEASCLLAEDINANHTEDTIIFIDINKESNSDGSQKKVTLNHITSPITIKERYIARLDKINALIDHCYNGPAELNTTEIYDVFKMLNLKNVGAIVSRCSKCNFYFLGDDEAKNISAALNLQQDNKLRSMQGNKPVIYIHARKGVNNEVFEHYSQYDKDDQRLKIKIIDSAYLSVVTLKQDKSALPVNCVEFDSKSGLVNSPFNALIVGFGSTGKEAFKFLYEFSAFVGTDMQKTPFKCYAIDEKMNRIAGAIKSNMPAIGEDELSLIQASVGSQEFWNKVHEIIKKLNYVVIALNNDNAGLSLAVNLFKEALKSRDSKLPMLKIMLRCYDNANEKRMAEVLDNLNNSIKDNNLVELPGIEIRLFGRERDLYNYNSILFNTIFNEAKEFNRVYENSSLTAEKQWDKNFGANEIVRLTTKKKMSHYHAIYDINRRIEQNISNSLHKSTKMILMGLDGEDQGKEVEKYYNYVKTRNEGSIKYDCNEESAKLLLHLAMVEHERWVASHKLMGYTYDAENDSVQKKHKCIVHWDYLDEGTQSYDCNVVDTTIKLLIR